MAPLGRHFPHAVERHVARDERGEPAEEARGAIGAQLLGVGARRGEAAAGGQA